MNYCLNHDCQKPTSNPPEAKFCLSCGSKLLLKDRYRAIKLIGQGGFGRTLLAADEHKPSKPRCVIKQFFPQSQSISSTQKAAELFEQEAVRLDELGKHPQIPELLAHFGQDGRQYLVQEFIDGQNLAQVLEAEGAFSEMQLKNLLSSLLPVLQFLHTHNIIHRDIKPENIIRRTPPTPPMPWGATDTPPSTYPHGTTDNQQGTTDTAPSTYPHGTTDNQQGTTDTAPSTYPYGTTNNGQRTTDNGQRTTDTLSPPMPWGARGGELVLVDFGAAKFANSTALARTGTVIGSAAYAAPEQVGGKAVFSSDLYSLGVTCIHLLTQVDPFDLYSFSEDAWVWRDYLKHPVSDQLGYVLDKLIQRAINRRYQSAEQVLKDLNSLQTRTGVALNNITVTTANRTANSALAAPAIVTSSQPQTQTWRCVHTLTGHSGPVFSVALSPDGQTLASGSRDDTIKLWDLETKSLICSFPGGLGQLGGINSVAISPDGRMLASGSSKSPTIKSNYDHLIKLWDLQTGRLITTLTGHTKSVYAVAFSQDGQTLISGSYDQTIKIWHLHAGSLNLTLAKHFAPVRSIATSPDGQILASGSDDATVNLWNLQTGEVVRSVTGLYPVLSVAISPDGKTVVGGGYDYTIKLWNLDTGKLLGILCDHSNWVKAVAISPDGQILASGGNDYTIKLWHIETRRIIGNLTEHFGCINFLKFSCDGRTLISGSSDNTIKIWQCD